MYIKKGAAWRFTPRRSCLLFGRGLFLDDFENANRTFDDEVACFRGEGYVGKRIVDFACLNHSAFVIELLEDNVLCEGVKQEDC